jgi:lysophospholipase L1-like esterase
MLGVMLDQQEPHGLRYEVVNAGVSGLNSELALRRLRSKVIDLDPDVVTIYIGWNDLMKVDPLSQGNAQAHLLSSPAQPLDPEDRSREPDGAICELPAVRL